MAGAFDGLRVLDVTTGIAGAIATMWLGDFGAEVLRVEPTGGGRLVNMPGALCWNRNKLRVEADVETDAGLRQVHDLIATAGVAVFDHSPAVLARFGFDPERCRRQNPRLAHAWLPPYGLAEPWANLPARDSLLAALTGMAHLQAAEPGVPVRLLTPQASYAHGVLGALATAAAVFQRAQTGRALPVHVTGLHAVSAIESGGLVRAEGASRLFGRGSAANYRLYECGDGTWLFFGALTPAFFLRALDVLGLVELMAHADIAGEFTSILQPPGSLAATDAIGARLRENSGAEWERRLRAAGVPVALARTREDWFRGETIAAHSMRTILHDGRYGDVEMPGLPLELSDTPGAVRGLMGAAPAEGWSSPRRDETPADPAPSASSLPLSGVRVLDLGSFVAGPFAPTLLAAFGADVIKVEPPEGDPFRTYGLTFAAHNRGKRSAVVDLKTAEGLAQFEQLVRSADVLVDNLRPGVRDRLGISDSWLRAANPRLIACSVTGYGGKGPFANDPGFDPVVQAQGGLMRAQGGGGPPVFHQVAVNDTAAALTAAFGVVAALVARRRTGKGQFVRTNLAVQAAMFQSGELTTFPGAPPTPVGGPGYVGPWALDRLYRCSDGWLSLSCETAAEAAALASVLFGTIAFEATTALSESAHGRLALQIEAAVAQRSRMGLIEELLAAGVPCAPALTPAEIFDDPSLAADGFIDQFDDAAAGQITGVARFAEWDGLPRLQRAGAPALGEHTAEVVRELTAGQ